MFFTSTLVRSKNEVRDINQKTQNCLFVNWDFIMFKNLQVFFIYPIPSAWTYKEPVNIILKISPNNKPTWQKAAFYQSSPLHSTPKKNLQRITKIPTKNKHQTPSNPPRNIFWPSSWKNPMCCNSRLTGTAHGPQVEKFHPVSLPNPEGSLRTKKQGGYWVEHYKHLKLGHCCMLLLVFCWRGNNDLLGTRDNVEVFICKVVPFLHCEQLPWPCMDRKTFCLVRCICDVHSQYG